MICLLKKVDEEQEHAWTEGPTLVFEVVSPRTGLVDHGYKQVVCLANPTLQAYVRVEAGQMMALVEAGVGADWVGAKLDSPADALHLPSVGIEIPLAELYEGVNFEP